MENAGENLQGRSTSQITEIVCSVILLICLFLPWVTLQIGGRSTYGMSYDTSYSAFDGINLIAKMNRSSSSFADSSFLPVSQFILFLYFILILYIANPIVQYFKRLPWLSFYTAWMPVTAGIMLLYKTIDGGSSGFGGFGIGAGAVLSLLAGLVMQFSAWTTIGIHRKEHRKYFCTALIWCIAGWLCFIVGGAIAVSDNVSLFDSFTDYNSAVALLYLFSLIFFLAVVGVGHTLWIVYGGMVMLFSSSSSSISSGRPTRNPAQEKADEFLNQVRRRSDEELKTILQHKEDYNERLVRAAKIIMLERISTPDSSVSSGISDSTVTPPAEETSDDKYKAYWPSASNPAPETSSAAMPEQERFQPSSVAKDDSFDAIRESWKTKAKEEDRKTAGVQSVETAAPMVRSSKNGHIVLISILAGVLLAGGGISTYFLWYVPYAKDKDAPRTYVVANNVFLRSSRTAGIESNILRKVPYGTRVITYNKLGDWAEVKVDGQEGVMAAPYLLDSLDFALLDRVWDNNDAKECIESSKCRLAILDYFKKNHLQSGQHAWKFYANPVDQKPNTVFYPRIYNANSKYTDFVFIVGNGLTGNRVLVCYSFDDATEKPIFRFSTGAPQTGFIKNIVNKSGNVRIIFDNNESVNLSL